MTAGAAGLGVAGLVVVAGCFFAKKALIFGVNGVSIVNKKTVHIVKITNKKPASLSIFLGCS